jgi:thiol-disulfide isomerase/thioredoxin
LLQNDGLDRYIIKFAIMRKLILLILTVSVALPVAARRAKRPEPKAPETMTIVLDSAKIAGNIYGYNSSFPFKTGELSHFNPFTGAQIPQAFLIADDGTFEVKFPAWFTSQVMLKMGGLLFSPFIEPGATLAVTLGTDPVKKKIVMVYNGDLARENTEITAFERTDVPWAQREEAYKSDDWQATDNLFRPVMNDNLRRLDEALAADSISKKVHDFLRYKEFMHYAEAMLSRGLYARDAPAPPEYYDFMREIPFDDPGFVSAATWVIANRIEFMDPINRGYYKKFTRMGPAEYFENRGIKLTDEEGASFTPKYNVVGEVITIDEEETAERELTKEKVREKYPEVFEEYEKYSESILPFPGRVENVRLRLAHADSVWQALTGRQPGLMMDIVAMNALDDIRRNAGDLSPADIVRQHRVVYDRVEHPFLRDEVWRHYEEMLPRMGGHAVELPQGPAADIMHGILDKFKGKPVLVDFWGTACGPCVATLKGNKENRVQAVAKGTVVLAYVTSPSWSPHPAQYEQFVAENELTNSVRLTQDEWNLVAGMLKILSVPRYVLFDEQGRVVDSHHSGFLQEFM